MEKICKTLSFSPIEVSGWKCLKLGFSEFLSLLYLLPLRKRCTSTTDFRNIGVKSWVLVLKTLGVKTLSHLSVHVLQSLICFIFALGPKESLKISTKYPALVIMPIFTIWTFGPASFGKYCTSCCQKPLLKVSYPLTLLNLIISTIPLFLSIDYDSRNYNDFSWIPAFLCFFCLAIIWFTFILLLLIEYCNKCLFCEPCSLCPTFEKTILDPKQPNEVIPWQMEDPAQYLLKWLLSTINLDMISPNLNRLGDTFWIHN